MTGEPTLHKGVSSEWVIHLQEVMRDRGLWHGATDGSFDDELERAVQVFQDNSGLMQTGVVDDDTWQALEHAPVNGHAQAHAEHAHAAAATHDEAAASSGSHPTLHKGISGEWVLYLQQVMLDRGYWHGATDGTFDDALELAVQQLQDHCGLMQTGVVDANTWHTLEQLPSHQPEPQQQQAEANASSGEHPTLRKGVSSEWVRYLQQVMQHVGYWTGATDGSFDDALEAAVAQVQGAGGLTPSGIVDAATWALLDRLAQQGSAQQGSAQQGSGTQAAAAHRSVAEMSATEKLVEAFNRAEINAAFRARVLAALSPEALAAAVLSFAAVFVASQFTPVGWAADIALGLTAVFVGTALFRAASLLIEFAGAANATTDEQLTAAGHAFAQAVAEIEVDALLFLITRAAGGPGGGAPANTPPAAGVVLATRGGQLVIVAADTIPVTVAGQLGIAGGTTAMAMSGTPRDDPDYWEERYGDQQDDRPRRQRISDGNKAELEESGWLRQRLPNADRRREFMEWLQRRHEQGEAHVHLRPGSREAEAAVQEFEAENP